MFSVVVQAGGQSRRMGRDKACLPFQGEPLIQRVVRRVQPIAGELLVTTNRPEDYAFLGVPLVPDLVSGSGTLVGLYTALAAARGECVAVVACDMPFVSAELLSAERDLLEEEQADAVLPRSEQGLEPLHAVYRRDPCLEAVQRALSAGQTQAISWLPWVHTREMSVEEVRRYDPLERAFLNINTPDEWRRAESLAAGD